MPPRKGKTLIGLDIDYLADQAGGVHISEEEIDAAFEFFDVDKSVCTCARQIAPYLLTAHSELSHKMGVVLL